MLSKTKASLSKSGSLPFKGIEAFLSAIKADSRGVVARSVTKPGDICEFLEIFRGTQWRSPAKRDEAG